MGNFKALLHLLNRKSFLFCRQLVKREDFYQRKLMQRIEYLRNIWRELANGNNSSISLLKSAVEFYIEFMKHFHLS